MATTTSTEALWGADAVLRHLRQQHGIRTTRRTLHRWRSRPKDPLPATFDRKGAVGRVHVRADLLDAWVGRNFAV